MLPFHPRIVSEASNITNIANSCYNNCPSDDRAPAAHNQVTAYCRNVTTTSSAVPSTTAAASSAGASSSNSIATNLNAPPPTNTGFDAGKATPTSGKSSGTANQVAGLALLAGAVVALL